MWLFICLLVFVVCAGVLIKAEIESKAHIKQVILEDEKRKAEQDKLREEIEKGTWVFPSKSFYYQCLEAKAIELDNEYCITKATDIAVRLIKKALPSIEEESYAAYINVEKMASFIKEGEKQHKEEEKERIKKMKTPKEAQPTALESTFISRAAALSVLNGSKKREQMLHDLISDYNAKITAISEGEKAMKTLGMVYLDQQKKESDWAVMGGIAEGIAGPAAGLAVAINTMANNAKIQQYNENMRQTSKSILSGTTQLSEDRTTLEKERNKLLELLSETKKKISLSTPNSAEIWETIKKDNVLVKKNESGVLSVTANITFKSPLSVKVPDGVQLVVDGTLKSSLYYENNRVGDVYFPLPLFGIPVNTVSSITLDGMCDHSVEYGGKYAIKFENEQNLWVMEK